jgi:thiamine-monophosphate kinase
VKVTEIGEFGLIRRFSPPFLASLAAGELGIGDDCAVLPQADGTVLLATTDMLVEDVHFLRRAIPPADLGWKSLAVNLSDLAAMGGAPHAAFLSLALPREVEVEWVDGFFAGLRELADATGTELLGGDTTSSPDRIVVNIAVLGSARPERVKLRSGARPGDAVCVSDFLGDSGGGLALVLAGSTPADADEAVLLRAHNRPRPHLAEGTWLAARPEVRAMMDVSDGVDSDLRRIGERSHCGARVDLARLPVSPALARVGARRKWDVDRLAAAAGEDYCLLLAVDPGALEALAAGFVAAFGRPLAVIGAITGEPEAVRYERAGREAVLHGHGFDHFAADGGS